MNKYVLTTFNKSNGFRPYFCSDLLFWDLFNINRDNNLHLNFSYFYNDNLIDPSYDLLINQDYKLHYNNDYDISSIYKLEISQIFDNSPIIFTKVLPVLKTYYPSKKIKNVTFIDDGFLERLFYINDPFFFVYKDFITANFDNCKIITGNQYFYKYMLNNYFNNIVYIPLGIYFKRLDNLRLLDKTTTDISVVGSCFENNISDKVLIKNLPPFLKDKKIVISFAHFDFIKNKIMLFRKFYKTFPNKYIKDFIDMIDCYFYYRYDFNYAFMVRSIWEMFYLNKYMYYYNPDNTNILDGFLSYLNRGYSVDAFRNKEFKISKEETIKLMTLDTPKFLEILYDFD